FSAQDRHLLARLQAADRTRRFPAERHYFRSEHSDRRDWSRGTSQLRGRFHGGDALDQKESARRAREWRREQYFVFFSWEQYRAGSDARGIFVSRNPRRTR